ncbi:putative calcium-binding protein CML19 [Platanthera zijinensis]|uniref:Calcium-binding protein CML19 n=1 Tax=Platanthera zijinensis TaxID=2320716 RepID=A0AAP0FSQ7_9ASPA
MKISGRIRRPSFLSRIRGAISPKKPKQHSPPPASPAPPAHHGFEQVFRSWDVDGDGKISAPELRRGMSSFSGEKMLQGEAEAAIEASDSDGDGKLGYGDFLMLVEAEEGEEKERSLMDAFAAYEMEGKGGITAGSLRRTLRRLGEERSLEDCKLMMRGYDLNGDGVISFDEFKAMMR